MRTILTGSPGVPYVLQAGDLPADHDLRYSFWRWVDFRNFDLSMYNMNYMDIYDCMGGGVTLPTNIRLLESHRTDWTGAIIPKPALANMMHDLIAEELRQRIVNLTGTTKTIMTVSRDHLDWRVVGDAAYLHSWTTMVGAWAAQGLVTEARINLAGTFWQQYPKLAPTFAGVRPFYTKAVNGTLGTFPTVSTVPQTTLAGGIELAPFISGALDRWATARMLELLFPAHKFVCLWLYPVPYIRTSLTGDPEEIVGA